MSYLKVFADVDASDVLIEADAAEDIAELMENVGVRFEQWQATAPVSAGDPPEKVMAAYQSDIERLKKEQGYVTVDVVSLNADHPDKVALREKFLSEHAHGEDEVRFFVAGRGLFSLHVGKRVYEVLCEAGDLISVPAKTPHWFDMGPNPHFVAIRLFNNPEGWVAQYTGNDIASRFSRLDN
ncbi:MAG TPA: acireductone dioxygenase [Pseudomonadales bacterium]